MLSAEVRSGCDLCRPHGPATDLLDTGHMWRWMQHEAHLQSVHCAEACSFPQLHGQSLARRGVALLFVLLRLLVKQCSHYMYFVGSMVVGG